MICEKVENLNRPITKEEVIKEVKRKTLDDLLANSLYIQRKNSYVIESGPENRKRKGTTQIILIIGIILFKNLEK